MFKLLRKSIELKDQIKYNVTYHDPNASLSMGGLMGSMIIKKKMHKRARTKLDLLKKVEEEDEDEDSQDGKKGIN
jgi:hypothetical protein